MKVNATLPEMSWRHANPKEFGSYRIHVRFNPIRPCPQSHSERSKRLELLVKTILVLK